MKAFEDNYTETFTIRNPLSSVFSHDLIMTKPLQEIERKLSGMIIEYLSMGSAD
jgi:hypothetical protein